MPATSTASLYIAPTLSISVGISDGRVLVGSTALLSDNTASAARDYLPRMQYYLLMLDHTLNELVSCATDGTEFTFRATGKGNPRKSEAYGFATSQITHPRLAANDIYPLVLTAAQKLSAYLGMTPERVSELQKHDQVKFSTSQALSIIEFNKLDELLHLPKSIMVEKVREQCSGPCFHSDITALLRYVKELDSLHRH